MSNEQSEHYIAQITVKKVIKTVLPRTTPHSSVTPPQVTKTTVASIIVSAADLESLKQKASAHLALVEDGGDISEGSVTR